MRIDGKPGITAAAATAARRRTGPGGFSVDESRETAAPARTAATGPTTSLDAILALQSEEDPGERRRRAASRGRDILDELDRLKAAILSGRVPPDALQRLAQRLSQRREASGDPRLDGILAQIELRAEVEIAKLQARAENASTR